MAQFIAFPPKIEVSAEAILSVIEGMGALYSIKNSCFWE